MYFVLYDRFFNSIGETYILEDWSRIQRATDFDDIRIVGEQIPYSAEPFFVVVNDRQGKLVFSGLASTPIIDDKEKKTTLVLKDYRTLFNSDVVVNWNSFFPEDAPLAYYLTYILSAWKNQVDVGFDNIEFDLERVANIVWDNEAMPIGTDTESFKLYEAIQDVMNYYNVYCVPELDVYKKKLTFTFYVSNSRHVSIRLKDFGINSLEKSFGEYNRATVYSSGYSKMSQWALTESNEIVRLPTTRNDLVYPGKNKNFVAQAASGDLTADQAVWNATYEAVMGLAANRFQENIDLDLKQYQAISGLEELTFEYGVSVYTEDGFYKEIPVSEIETDSKGTHIVRLGRRVQELTQEI